MPLPANFPLALGRFKRLPQRSTEVWQGGIVRMPVWIEAADPDAAPWRPMGVVWVSLRTGLVHMAMPAEGSDASADLALSALVEFGLKWAKRLEGRPVRVEVGDAALRDALTAPLAALSTAVALVDDLPAVRDVLGNMEAETSGGERLPGLMESPGVTLDLVRDFAAAAAAFYTAAPWRYLANEDLLVVDTAGAPKTMRHVSVLGQGGEQFGVAFFDSRRAFERVLDADTTGRPPTRAHGVTFGPIDELPFADVDLWLDHELPVAGASAYPLAADLHIDRPMRRPTARELVYATTLLRALAATTEDELDTGRWQRRIDGPDGPADVMLTLPDLLAAEAGAERPRPGSGRLLAEQAGARIARALEGRTFDTIEDMNAALETMRKSGEFDLEAGMTRDRPLSALEQAQELAYEAMEAEGRRQIKLARQALALSPDCADAWTLLGDAAATPEAARECYQQAVAAGARAIGPDAFSALAGQFWGHIETRPYMRARLALADVLGELGRTEEALDHLRELLRLNPNDNQGVRYQLLARLLDLHRLDEVETLLDAYPDDGGAFWPYARLLWRFRTQGDGPAARAALTVAVNANPFVVPYFLAPDSLPLDRPASYALGSREEAIYVADELGDAYGGTPGMQQWLSAHHPRRRSGRRTTRH